MRNGRASVMLETMVLNASLGSIVVLVESVIWSVAGDRNKDGRWVLSQRVQDSGTDIQYKISFSCIFVVHGRRSYKGVVRCRHGLRLGGHGGLRGINGGS